MLNLFYVLKMIKDDEGNVYRLYTIDLWELTYNLNKFIEEDNRNYSKLKEIMTKVFLKNDEIDDNIWKYIIYVRCTYPEYWLFKSVARKSLFEFKIILDNEIYTPFHLFSLRLSPNDEEMCFHFVRKIVKRCLKFKDRSTEASRRLNSLISSNPAMMYLEDFVHEYLKNNLVHSYIHLVNEEIISEFDVHMFRSLVIAPDGKLSMNCEDDIVKVPDYEAEYVRVNWKPYPYEIPESSSIR